jgi:hypothetical protein
LSGATLKLSGALIVIQLCLKRAVLEPNQKRRAELVNVDRGDIYREQAAYCAYLLNRPLEPSRRALLERERQDWLLLADQHEMWAHLKPRAPTPDDEAPAAKDVFRREQDAARA